MGTGILPVSTINPPTLKSVRGDYIVKFNVEYERYRRQVSEVNAGLQEPQRVKPVGYKACITGELLLSLVELNVFNGISNVSDLTDENVKAWLDSRTTCNAADIPGQVRDALSRVRYVVDQKDPEGAAYSFFIDVISELRRNRVSNVLSDSPQVIIQNLLGKIEPQQTRETVQSEYEFWTKEEKEDFSRFNRFVIKTAVESAKYTKKSKHRTISVTEDKLRHSSPVLTTTKRNQEKNDGNDKKGEEKGKRKWKDKCLNPACSEHHPLYRCTITSKEYARELLAKRRADLKRAKGLKSMRMPSAKGGRYRCHIPGGITIIGLGDYGADNSAISSSLLKNMRSTGKKLQVTKLQKPMQLQAAINLPDAAEFTVSSTILMDITLVLPCGNLILRNVSFWVVDQDMDEIILGRPLLRCIGFDLDKALTKLQQEVGEIDISERMCTACNGVDPKDGTESFKVSSMRAYKGLWYEAKEYDPIVLPDGIMSSMGVDKPEEILAEVKKTLNRANEAGMKPSNLQRCETIMKKYIDIGARLILSGSDMAFMMAGAKAQVNTVRSLK